MKSSKLQKDKNVEENLIRDVKNLEKVKRLETGKSKKKKSMMPQLNLFRHKPADYYKPVRLNKFWNNNYINIKVKVIEKHYQL